MEEIEHLWLKLGRQPTTTDIKAGISQYSLNTFARHFGSWRGALNSFLEYVNHTDSLSDRTVDGLPTKTPSIKSRVKQENTTIRPQHRTPREPNLRLRFKVMQRDNFKCCICGETPANNPRVTLHIDHVYPWEKGGETVLDNLQALCSDCNLGKSNLV